MLDFQYDDATVLKAEDDARRSLLVRYFERQLGADRILALYDGYNSYLAACSSVASFTGSVAPMDGAQFMLSYDELIVAQAQGFTRSWHERWDEGKGLYWVLEADDALPLIGEADGDDWVIVDRDTDIPALPTNPGGRIEFTRLDLCHVELVSFDNWREFLWTVDYGNDDTNATANRNARRNLLTRYLERQLQADRILTQSQLEYSRLQSGTDLEPFYATREEKQLARDQGLTRLWDWDYVEKR